MVLRDIKMFNSFKKANILPDSKMDTKHII